MQPDRFTNVPGHPPLLALTATARGMVDQALTRAARLSFDELMGAIDHAGLTPLISTCMGFVPDTPQGQDDRQCRYVAAVLFGHAVPAQQGECIVPDLPLTGSLAWQPIKPGRFAVFTHRGPYYTLHRSWQDIYRKWLPVSGQSLRDAPPMELRLNDASITLQDDLLTEIWIPVT
jgi:AraC family transcriptional regulator